MKLMNKYNLPKVVYDRIHSDILSDPYGIGDKQGCFRTTEMLGAPLPRTLFRQYKESDKLVIDASFYLQMMFGTAFHSICEGEDTKTTKYECRCMLEFEYNGQAVQIYGTIDQLDEMETAVLITDNKTGMKAHLKFPVRDEYIQQTNVYRLMVSDKFDKPFKLFIRYFLKDFTTIAAANNSQEPQCQMQVKPVPLWNDKQVMDFIASRVADHIENPERLCTKQERNFGNIKYKIKHPDRKQALVASYVENGVRQDITTIAKAQEMLETVKPNLRAKAYIDEQADDIKCKHYCHVVSVCPYAKKKGYKPF